MRQLNFAPTNSCYLGAEKVSGDVFCLEAYSQLRFETGKDCCFLFIYLHDDFKASAWLLCCVLLGCKNETFLTYIYIYIYKTFTLL